MQPTAPAFPPPCAIGTSTLLCLLVLLAIPTFEPQPVRGEFVRLTTDSALGNAWVAPDGLVWAGKTANHYLGKLVPIYPDGSFYAAERRAQMEKLAAAPREYLFGTFTEASRHCANLRDAQGVLLGARLPTETEAKRLAQSPKAHSRHYDFWTSTISGPLGGSARVLMGSTGEVQSLDREDLAHTRCVVERNSIGQIPGGMGSKPSLPGLLRSKSP